MGIFAIGDLHLSNYNDKPMDIFGWINHKEKIFEDWKERITDDDLVLLAGDISWANYLQEANCDLDEIASLPGTKIIVKGNHDFWWTTYKKMKEYQPELEFLHNNCFEFEDYVVAGTRGWVLPGKNQISEEDKRILERELARLKLSLDMATTKNKDIIVMLHYPPMNENFDQSVITELIEQYNVKKVIYGHLHGREGFKAGFIGDRNGIEYSLVSCDFLEFKLKKL